MPILLKKIIADKPNKPNYGQEITIRRYTYGPDNKPLGVLFGCFSPFTGKYGHGRLLSEARKRGITDFVIISPNKAEVLDNDRNMFTLQQKAEIARAGCEDIGYTILDASISKSNNFLAALLDVAEEYEDRRIVIICGPDRIPEYSKKCDEFDPLNEGPEYGKEAPFEYIGVDSRGEMEVSGSKVRACIRNNDEEGFLRMTGYSPRIWNMCRKFALSNKTINEALAATERKGIQHLYNPGNSMELGQLDFIELLDYLETQGDLVNGENFSLTEKSDGAAFRMGYDDEGKFFIEQSYSGPIYDADTLVQKYKQKYGKNIRLGKGWADMMTILQNDSKTQHCLSKIYDTYGPFKINAEIFISELGLDDGEGNKTFVGSRYSTSKIGKDGTIIMFFVADAEGKTIPDSQKIIKYLIKNATSKSIKYDDAELNTQQDITISLSSTIRKIKSNIRKIEAKLPDTIENILTNTSRKRDDLALKKAVKGMIEEQQGILNSVFEKQLENYEGKWGPDYEGVVIKLDNGLMLKITSKRFKEFKASHDDTLQKFIMSGVDESYNDYLMNVAANFLENWN